MSGIFGTDIINTENSSGGSGSESSSGVPLLGGSKITEEFSNTVTDTVTIDLTVA